MYMTDPDMTRAVRTDRNLTVQIGRLYHALQLR